MCGIAGIVEGSAAASGRARNDVERMTALLAHRGPDAQGIWSDEHAAFGHTRLSIIDLTATGCQPMQDPSGRWTLVYNGEVYNYRELRDMLRDRGHEFRGSSDTEVVLTALIEWGESALERFNGMWAFALWDSARRRLFVARDRAGKKPFYHAMLPGQRFVFASEITPLLRLGVPAAVDRQAAFDFLTQGTYGHLAERTFFAGIEQLPAAHCAWLTPGEPLRPKRYWDLPVIAERDRLPYDDEFRQRFRDLMIDAVRLRLRSDVPVGASLSGGLDSSTIVTVMDRLTDGAPLHLFTSLYPGTRQDETPYFDAVVRQLRHPVIHRAQPIAEQWRQDLMTVLAHQEEPFGDTSILAHFTLMRAAREAGVPVILNGQGGDELLLGYPSMVTAYLGAQMARGHARALGELWRWAPQVGMGRTAALRNALGATLPLAARDRIRERFVRRMADRIGPALRDGASLRRFEKDPRDALASYLRQIFTRFSIPHLTHYDDRNAMAFSIEGRMPFLDVRLVELMFAVRGEALFADGFTKRVLRESFADLLPGEVRQRRDKIGFYTPLGEWLRANDAWMTGFMTTERIRAAGLLRADRYSRALAELRAGGNHAALEVWRGFIVHLWLERFAVANLSAQSTAA